MTETADAQQAIRALHGCESQYVETQTVIEVYEGEKVWEGPVLIFDLQGHPEAHRAYVWSAAVDGSTEREYTAVLHGSGIDGPRAAVRAAIVKRYKARE